MIYGEMRLFWRSHSLALPMCNRATGCEKIKPKLEDLYARVTWSPFFRVLYWASEMRWWLLNRKRHFQRMLNWANNLTNMHTHTRTRTLIQQCIRGISYERAPEISAASRSTDDMVGELKIGAPSMGSMQEACQPNMRRFIIESRCKVWHYNISMLQWLWSLTTINNIHTMKCFFRYINCFVIYFYFHFLLSIVVFS